MGTTASMSGTALQSGASAHEVKDMAAAFRTEQLRQNRYRDQALGNFNNLAGTSGYGAYQQDSAQGAANRIGLYNQLANTRMSLTPTTSTGDARDLAAEQLAGQAQAKLGGYGDYEHAQSNRQLQSGRNLNQIENFAAGTGSVFPYRMYEAQHGWDWMRALGQGLGAIGGATGGMGGGSGTDFGSGPSTTQTTLGNYPTGANDNFASTYQEGAQSVGASPYVYYQMPTVQQNDANPYMAYFY